MKIILLENDKKIKTIQQKNYKQHSENFLKKLKNILKQKKLLLKDVCILPQF